MGELNTDLYKHRIYILYKHRPQVSEECDTLILTFNLSYSISRALSLYLTLGIQTLRLSLSLYQTSCIRSVRLSLYQTLRPSPSLSLPHPSPLAGIPFKKRVRPWLWTWPLISDFDSDSLSTTITSRPEVLKACAFPPSLIFQMLT